MQPLGYYGLNLDISTEVEIGNMPLHELTDLLDDMSDQMNSDHYLCNEQVLSIPHGDKCVTPDELTDLQKIGLIRALCDRIEIKLMEAAK
jgi:hypothetical protein